MRSSLTQLAVAFLFLTKIVSAQQSAPLPPFNQPVTCPDGLTYIVENCVPFGPDERCIFRSERNGQLVERANPWRAALSERLKDCKQLSRPTAGPAGAQTLNPPYLNKLPTVQRVLRDLQGKDAIDKTARQAGALWQLREVILTMALSQRRNDRSLTPDEERLRGEYYAASTRLTQLLQQQLAGDKTGRLFELQGYASDRKLLDEVLQRLCAPGFRDEYWKAEGQITGRIKAREERDKADQQRAQSEIKEWETKQQPKPWQRELSRCIASGRSESQCFAEALEKGAGDFLPGLKKIPRPSGLWLSGLYTSQGGFTVMFHSDGAWVGCKQVRWLPASFAVDTKNDQLVVRLMSGSGAGCFLCDTQAGSVLRQPKPGENPEEWEGQRIIFPVRSDGTLTATRVSPQPSGAVDVTGPVQVGTKPGTKVINETTNGITTTRYEATTIPIYETQTARCTLGPMTVDPSASASINFSEVLGSVLGVVNKTATKQTPPGFRVRGKYVGEDGFDIEFHPESAVVGCRDAAVARAYSVSTSGSQFRVNIQNGASPITLELRPDGTMAGSGSVEVNGRQVANVKERIEGTRVIREPVFQPVTDTCRLGILTPTEGARASATTAGAATTASTISAPAPTRSPGPTAGTRPDVAAGRGGMGTLSIRSGLAPEPGDDTPLDGASFILAKESFENVLRNAGLQPSPGGSAIKLWERACESGQQLCQQGMARLMAVGVSRIKLDAKGTAQIPALPSGIYYLVGSITYDGRTMIWDLKIDLKPGANSVTLDQRNAAPIN